ncbi:MAG: hydrogenase 3 maturation endopeptidase HyCI [Chloroflexi bacterium]|nr:hydrogenase 3 maturation endopeptidase HyCI [Chloroflexota bacterium]
MSSECWQASLHQSLSQLHNTPSKIAIMGIGNPLYGDDGVGHYIAMKLAQQLTALDFVRVIAAGIAPESCTGQLRHFGPTLTLLIDAAGFDAPAGAIRWLNREAIDGVSASTHTLPLTLLADYIEIALNSHVRLLGIQPLQMFFGTSLSPIAEAAADEVIEFLTSALLNLRSMKPTARK